MGTANQLQYIQDLSRKHYEEIGFLPRPRLEQYVESGQVFMEHENGDPCGFLVWGSGFPVLRIYQACIQYDAQRRQHGYALVRRLIEKADAGGYECISLWCADDLDANDFWKSCGFQWSGIRDGGVRRGRKHNRWMFWMPEPIQLRIPLCLSTSESEARAK
jgi:GNAT superfamily N-acetyltransferase